MSLALNESSYRPPTWVCWNALRDLDDHKSWQEFFDLYSRLIYLAAIKAGLTDHEAEEVLQETMICAARRMKDFRYQPEKCSFKGWMMHLTRHQVIDCYRKRRTQSRRFELSGFDPDDPVTEIPDHAAERTFQAVWIDEWRTNVLNAANQRVRRDVSPQHYLIYHLHCVKNLSASEVSKSLHVTKLAVYIVRHRVAQKIRREVKRLEKVH